MKPNHSELSPNGTVKHWDILSTRLVYSAKPWIEVSLQQVRLPNGKLVSDYHQIKLPEFCVIFTETTEGKVIVLRQYRHGVRGVTLTLPAGLLEDGENPLETAKRELLEETGYEASHWRSLGSFVPNSNYGCGKVHLFHANGAEHVQTANSGDLEDSELILMSKADLLTAVREGKILSLSAAAAIAFATHPGLSGGATIG